MGQSMHAMQFRRAFLFMALMCHWLIYPWAMLASAALPKGDVAPRTASLAGQLLVAAPDIGDPRFRHTVVLLVKHGKQGAFGIVVNRPADERSWASVLEAVGEKSDGVSGKVRIFVGGPVEPWIGFVVHSSDYRRQMTIDAGRIEVTSNAEILRDIAHGKGPKQSILAFGYSGWGAGQLEAEIAQGSWFTEPADPKLIFESDPGKIWDKAVERRTIPL